MVLQLDVEVIQREGIGMLAGDDTAAVDQMADRDQQPIKVEGGPYRSAWGVDRRERI